MQPKRPVDVKFGASEYVNCPILTMNNSEEF